jgi:hypothetical protein
MQFKIKIKGGIIMKNIFRKFREVFKIELRWQLFRKALLPFINTGTTSGLSVQMEKSL